MTTARTTEGLHPTRNANKISAGSVTAAASFLRRPQRNSSRLTRKLTCIPETATVWDRPTREKLARAESVSPSRVPSTTASVRPPASASAKQRSRESRSIPAHTTGQNRGGVGSARSTVRGPSA